jgi:phage gpG-like protein
LSKADIEIDTSEWDSFLSKMVVNLKRAQVHLKVAAQAFAFQDIIAHFRDEEGPEGKWAPRSQETQRRYAMIQSGQWRPPKGARAGSFTPTNKLLQLTGDMRKSLMPTEGGIKNVGSDAVMLFSNAEYSGRHDMGGGGIPARPFMWLSDATEEKMANTVLQLILEDQAGAA